MSDRRDNVNRGYFKISVYDPQDIMRMVRNLVKMTQLPSISLRTPRNDLQLVIKMANLGTQDCSVKELSLWTFLSLKKSKKLSSRGMGNLLLLSLLKP